MNLIIKYTIRNVPNVAQFAAAGANSPLAIDGVNFIGAEPTLAMAFGNTTSGANSHKGSVLPTTNNVSDGTYVDKIISIVIPATFDATTLNIFSVSLDKIGINNDIIGVETLGLTRTETPAIVAFARNILLEPNIGYSVSRNRLIITIGQALNAITGSTLNIRITYKN